MEVIADIVIVGCGVAGLFAALNLPKDKKIVMITKSDLELSDSFLAQGGISILKDEFDYDSYFEDTMRAGHYKNDKKSVEIMIKNSKEIAEDLINFGVLFEKKDGELLFTKEAAHSASRILFHKDITGYEIMDKLLDNVKKLSNVSIYEHTEMIDIVSENDKCYGVICKNEEEVFLINASYTIFATGGIGGLFEHSTNFEFLTGDAIAISLLHNIKLKNMDYIQIHPTTLYSENLGRRFLISESVRGEGGLLYNKNKERFVDELLPRDVVANAIYEQIKIDDMPYVWLSMENIDDAEIKGHFPNIYKHCKENGFDVTCDFIPVVPSQHYFMGGIWVDYESKTSMERLYAIGETSCNGVHGANRLASNSLLESMVFAKIAANHIAENYVTAENAEIEVDLTKYKDFDNLKTEYAKIVLEAIELEKERNGN